MKLSKFPEKGFRKGFFQMLMALFTLLFNPAFTTNAATITFNSLNMIDEPFPCGMHSEVIHYEQTTSRSGGAYDDLNPIISWEADFLEGQAVGVYHFVESLQLKNGDIQEDLYTVFLGYKCQWNFLQDAENYTNDNGIVNTQITDIGISRAETKNLIENASGDVQLLFQLSDVMVASGVYDQSDYFTLSFQNSAGEGVFIIAQPSFQMGGIGSSHLGSISYSLTIQSKQGASATTQATVSAVSKDSYVLVTKTTNDEYSVTVNQQPVTFSSGTTFTHSIIGISSVFYHSHVHNGFQIGSENVLMSVPCPVINYYRPQETTNSSFVVAKFDRLYFRHDEPYNFHGDLDFNVYDNYHRVVSSITTNSLEDPKVTYGENWMELDVSTLASGMYLLETSNSKGDKKYLRFKKP